MIFQECVLTEIASSLFLVGCALFALDGVLYLAEGYFTIHTFLYAAGSVLFLFGSIAWSTSERNNRIGRKGGNLGAVMAMILLGRAGGAFPEMSVPSEVITDERWLPLDDPLRQVAHVKPWPVQVYPTYPSLLKIHTTRPSGSCPHFFTEWNHDIDREKINLGESVAYHTNMSVPEAARDSANISTPNTKTSNEGSPEGSQRSHYSNVSPWLTSFDAALLRRNLWKAHGETEACCMIWKGTPSFMVRKPDPETIYMFQPCGRSRNDFQNFLEKHILPKLKKPFVLYSGGNDCSLHNDSVVQRILNHSLVKHWYTENYYTSLVSHPKLSAVPIGACQSAVVAINPSRAKAVAVLEAGGLPWDSRSDLVYTCGFLSDHTKNDRVEWFQWATKCSNTLCAPTCASKKNFLPADELFAEYGAHRFVLSPRGRGADTYRTWEILSLGSIPIIAKFGGEGAYAHLPVMAVDHISNVTRDALSGFESKWLHVLTNRTEMNRRLSHDWWVSLVRSGTSLSNLVH